MTPVRIWLVTAAVALGLAGTAVALPGFSTAPKTSPDSRDAALLRNAAVGCHGTFDRFVVQADLNAPGYDVRYVSRIVADPSGKPVQLLGAKRIRVVFKLAGGHDASGTNHLPPILTPRCPNLLQVKKTGDFEGVVSFGLGVRQLTGFRVFRLTNPMRVVIDVAH